MTLHEAVKIVVNLAELQITDAIDFEDLLIDERRKQTQACDKVYSYFFERKGAYNER